MTHEELREMIPAYAVDALAPEEAERVNTHLPACSECREELAVMLEAAAFLAAEFVQTAPPPELRDKILLAVKPRRRRAYTSRGAWAFRLAAAALVIVLAGIDISLQSQVAALRARAEAQARLVALLTSPATRTVELTGTAPGNVRLVFDAAIRRGALVASGLRDPGEDRVYQLWLVTGQAPESAGVFRPVPGQPTVVTVDADFNRYNAVAISLEHAPLGAASPTTKPILLGRIPGSD